MDGLRQNERSRAALLRAIAIVLLLSAAAECYWRGPLHKKTWRLYDIGSIYASSRALLQGTNPYDYQNCAAVWRQSGGPSVYGVPFTAVQVPIVPPSTYAAIAPIALLGARWAMRLWMYGEGAMILLEIVLLARLAGERCCSWQMIALAAGVLAFAPIHYSWVSGQTSISVLFAITLALCCVVGKKDLAAVALLGIAMAIKPPLVAPFIVYFFLAGRPRFVVGAVVVALMISGLAILQLQLHHIPWLHDWHRNVQATSAPGATNDFGRGNPDRFDLVFLQFLFSQVTDNRALVNGLAIGVTAILCLLYLVAYLRGRRRQSLLLAAGAAGALGLLPFYHRATDAVVLLIPLAWALSRLGARAVGNAPRPFLTQALPAVALILIGMFFLPEETGHALATGLRYQYLPRVVWDVLIVPLHVWALLLLCITLIAAMAASDHAEADAGPITFGNQQSTAA